MMRAVYTYTGWVLLVGVLMSPHGLSIYRDPRDQVNIEFLF